jgi:hypothetical protein
MDNKKRNLILCAWKIRLLLLLTRKTHSQMDTAELYVFLITIYQLGFLCRNNEQGDWGRVKDFLSFLPQVAHPKGIESLEIS